MSAAYSVNHGVVNMIKIDDTNTFYGLSSSNNDGYHPVEEELSKKTDEEPHSAAGDEVGEGEGISVPQIKTRQLKRGLSAEEGAQSIYSQNLSGCSWIESSKMKKIPKFKTKELMMGLTLGSGCFGAVYEIRGFHLTGATKRSFDRSKRDDDDEEVTPGEMESRNFIARHCYRNNGDARYAIKKLKSGILEDDSSFMNGMADLANETLYLASLQHHPNIIKLRGVAVENMFSKEYFLILDRLYDTLQVRILKWKKTKKHTKGFVRSIIKDRNGQKKRKLLEERMKYAMDLMAAIAYMHDHRIIHRDLKPDNIGFDVRNDIKVFDFGLAREMPPPKTNSPNETFKFTSAGSPRYMAPEVGLGQRHNQSCDIYSFGLVFWEMLTLKRPFKNERTMHQLKENVWNPWGRQERPSVPAKFSTSIQTILHESWNPDHRARPNAHKLLDDLTKECLKLRQDMRISHTARRSTFVMLERSSRSQEMKRRSETIKEESSSRLSVHSATNFDSTAIEDFDNVSWNTKISH
ncbi:unnamed protein product [Cylindrotheca closterium]|uniref:Protein kinase domain-containing protein n=1 Tax=Cylindrotheca closterium TaxID=2856 RepID=A0AAD2FRA2_9STRA|nr:unnamed protein product [Cylindrotheca closterium]